MFWCWLSIYCLNAPCLENDCRLFKSCTFPLLIQNLCQQRALEIHCRGTFCFWVLVCRITLAPTTDMVFSIIRLLYFKTLSPAPSSCSRRWAAAATTNNFPAPLKTVCASVSHETLNSELLFSSRGEISNKFLLVSYHSKFSAIQWPMPAPSDSQLQGVAASMVCCILVLALLWLLLVPTISIFLVIFPSCQCINMPVPL